MYRGFIGDVRGVKFFNGTSMHMHSRFSRLGHHQRSLQSANVIRDDDIENH